MIKKVSKVVEIQDYRDRRLAQQFAQACKKAGMGDASPSFKVLLEALQKEQ